MRKYEQLIVAEQSAELTLEEQEFVEVHRRIVACGELTGRYLFEMCNQIKRMRDDKLYAVAGFKKFEDYTEQALKVKRRQAYNYIKLAETYSEKYIVENADLGITKLALLAGVTEEEREEITETIDVVEANPDRVAVKGIHVASLEFAQKYGDAWSDVAILELEVDILDMVVPDAKDQLRASKVKVLREVPFSEMGDCGARHSKNINQLQAA